MKNSNTLKRLYKDYTSKFINKILLAAFFSVLVAASTSATAWLLDPAIEKIFLNKDQTLILIIPFAIILSSFFLKETISIKKWLLIISSFLGIVLIAFDPNVLNEILGFLLICGMAFFYGLSQVFSRYLKELDVKFTNALMGLIGFIILFSLSNIFEGNVVAQIKNIDLNGWLTVLYAGGIIFFAKSFILNPLNNGLIIIFLLYPHKRKRTKDGGPSSLLYQMTQ